MLKTITIAVLTATILASGMQSASAFVVLNGKELNGKELNGKELNGVDTSGVSLVAIELPRDSE